jgi:hypothetical protein
MVFAVNSVEDSQKSFAAFQKLAEQKNGSTSASGSNTATGASATDANGALSQHVLNSGMVLFVSAIVASLL